MEPKIDLTKLADDLEDTISIDNPGNTSGSCGYELGYGATPPYSYGDDTITLSSYPWSSTSINNTSITGGGFAYPNTVLATGGPYTLNSGAGTGVSQPWPTYTGAPTLNLNGEGADIKVNDWSLVDAIKKLEERLNLLTPNTKLEEEWEELRALGNKYRELEQHIKDKQATWDRLTAMPPPVID